MLTCVVDKLNIILFHHMRLKCIYLLFIIISPLFSQINILNENKVDSILNESFQQISKLQFIESLKLSDKALHLSLEIEYEKGTVYSYLYIAWVFQEVGLRKDALTYIEKIEDDNYFQEDAFVQAETHRLKGRIASSQGLYSLEKEHYLKQLEVSQHIVDMKKRNLSITMAYFYIQHLYAKQNDLDSVEVYQDLLKNHFSNNNINNDTIRSYYYISLYADKGLLYKNLGRFDEAAVQLDKSLEYIQNGNSSLLFYILQLYGDLEVARGDTMKAIACYKEALDHSLNVNINHKTMYLHKRISDLLIHDELTIEEAKSHLREYNIISDSLERHNKMVSDIILSGIVKEKEEASSKRILLFVHIVGGLILLSILLGVFLILRNRVHKRNLMKKNRQLDSTTKKIELLEEELESNIYQDIVELAKSNSPEFLPLFEKGYPEFVAAMRNLNPSIRSSELYFCALAYLNFSTKDIANYTFVTDRAVQVRRNRMRKKYNIPSEIDFNEWFRSRTNGDMVDEN